MEIVEMSTSTESASRVHLIETYRIRPNPAQPRREFADEPLLKLAESIRQHGLLQPLTVRLMPEVASDGTLFELVAGERRLRAAKLLGLQEVPCILLSVDGKRSAELAIIENLQREDLNLFEQAQAIASLLDIYAMTQEEIARRLSVSQSYVANKLRILRLSPFERELILKNHFTERHARALLRLSTQEARISALQEMIAKNMNVSMAEMYVERILATTNSAKKRTNKPKFVMKDIRLFYNTIDRAVDTIRRTGLEITTEKTELENCVEVRIVIPKQGTQNSPKTEGTEEKFGEKDAVPASVAESAENLIAGLV